VHLTLSVSTDPLEQLRGRRRVSHDVSEWAVSQPLTFRIGADVSCSDGEAGRLGRVVVDPIARAVTHLAVEPKQGPGLGRLVPVDKVESTYARIQLRCTTAEYEALEDCDETRLLPVERGVWGYSPGELLALPYYGLGFEGMTGAGTGLATSPQAARTDRVPVGEIQIRRGDAVHATDGTIGRVQGLVIDPRDRHLTHVLLDEGHLWGKKQVVIPVAAIANVDDGVRLKLNKGEVRDLPEVDVVSPG
jgi:sporulation protein YlmC with PRC-barrel domain